MCPSSAVYVAMMTLAKGEWGETMEAHTKYSETDILPCAHAMARLQKRHCMNSEEVVEVMSAVHKKYSTSKFMQVARLMPPPGLGQPGAT